MNNQAVFKGLGVNLLAAIILVLIIGATSASAATIKVNTLDDELNTDGDCSFREAVMASENNTDTDQCKAGGANGADTIDLTDLSGTISVSGGEMNLTENLTVIGSGMGKLTLDGGNYSQRLFAVNDPNSTQTVEISDLSINRFGYLPDTLFGGALYVSKGNSLGLDKVKLEDNHNLAGFGGAIGTSSGIVKIFNSILTNNQAQLGGAIANKDGTITSVNNSYINNQALSAAAIYQLPGVEGTTSINNDIYTGNKAKNGGGSIWNENGAVNISNTDINANDGGLFTGGIYNNTGKVKIENSSIRDNLSDEATAILNYGDISIYNTTISGNKAVASVPGVYNGDGGTILLFNSTIAYNIGYINGNAVVDKGMGLYQEVAANQILLQNTIIFGNKSSAELETDDCNATISSVGSNIIGNDKGCIGFDPIKDNLNVDPLLLPLTVNMPGITATHALAANSPAIDKGQEIAGITTDQRGVTRPQGAGFDIGAYEYSDSPELTEVTAIPTPSTDTTPTYTFSTTKAGNITYGGGCTSTTTLAVVGNNTITFNALVPEFYSNCTITVTDSSGQISNVLKISSFNIFVESASSGGSNGGGGGSASFGKPASSGGGVADFVGGDEIIDSNSNWTFTDINNHWAQTDILTLAKDCNILGYKDQAGNLLHIFKPDQKISRAELLNMVVKCKFGALNNPVNAPFPDVSANHWAAASIKQGLESKIVQGYPDGTFKPDQFTIRAEALKIILLTWVKLEDVSNSAVNNSCKDVIQKEWYAKFFNFSLGKNIVSGYLNSDGTPTGNCGVDQDITRAEAAKIIVKAKSL